MSLGVCYWQPPPIYGARVAVSIAPPPQWYGPPGAGQRCTIYTLTSLHQVSNSGSHIVWHSVAVPSMANSTQRPWNLSLQAPPQQGPLGAPRHQQHLPGTYIAPSPVLLTQYFLSCSRYLLVVPTSTRSKQVPRTLDPTQSFQKP